MARLQSINAGLPRDMAWRGEKVHTAIWKQAAPPAGSRSCGRTRHWPTNLIYAKRSHGPMEFTVFQFAGTCRSCDVSVQWSGRTGSAIPASVH
jgi:hypothetical protein